MAICSPADSRTRHHAPEEIRRTGQHSKIAFTSCGHDASPDGVPILELVNLSRFQYHSLFMGVKIITVLVRFLEGMFAIGAIGSFVVIVLSGIEDLKMLLGREEENHS